MHNALLPRGQLTWHMSKPSLTDHEEAFHYVDSKSVSGQFLVSVSGEMNGATQNKFKILFHRSLNF